MTPLEAKNVISSYRKWIGGKGKKYGLSMPEGMTYPQLITAMKIAECASDAVHNSPDLPRLIAGAMCTAVSLSGHEELISSEYKDSNVGDVKAELHALQSAIKTAKKFMRKVWKVSNQ